MHTKFAPSLSKWDKRFFELACYIAEEWSKDPTSKVGAVLVSAEEITTLSLGINGFPPGIADTDARLADKVIKNSLMIHAEHNALDHAHFDLTGSTLYVTRFPCHRCAGSLIKKRVARVVAPSIVFHELSSWYASCVQAVEMFAEVGIDVTEALLKQPKIEPRSGINLALSNGDELIRRG